MNVFKRILILIVFLHVSTLAVAAGGNSNEIENQIKATYLYKFTSYVEWPVTAYAQSDTPFVIGIVGSNEIAAELKKLVNGNTMKNRTVEIRNLSPNESQPNVQLLFIGKHENGMLKHILNAMQSQPVLTITESTAGLDDGSIINFITIDDHVRFEVSVAQAERSGLKISARLLMVAQKIESKRP